MSEGPGPRVRTDIVEAFVFRRSAAGPEFLQVRRARAPQAGAWHPVLGHVEAGESAVGACARELREELGLHVDGGDVKGLWQLEQVHPFFLADEDVIVMSPRFVVEVASTWTPALNEESTDARWVRADDIDEFFVWPGQRAACREAISEVVVNNRAAHVRVRP